MTWRLDPAEDAWRGLARCAQADPDEFFPIQGRPRIKTCNGCPVKAECLSFALSSPWEPSGVWGGLLPNRVRSLWRREFQRRLKTDPLATVEN